MTLLYNNNKISFLLSHNDYVSKIFKNVCTCIQNDLYNSYIISPKMFAIKNTRTENNNKRSRKYNELIEETQMVKQIYNELITIIPVSIKERNCHNDFDTNEVREYSKQLFECTQFDHRGINGNNSCDTALKVFIKNEYFLIPPRSTFFSGCVKEKCKALTGNKYDIVIADPPWWNKYIRRLKRANDKMSYSMMYNEDIASIPVSELFADNCLILVWCTNASSNIDAVKNLIFPKWGVKYLATWYWMKVTVDLVPVCNFGSGCKKQPYERIIVGCVGEVKDIPDKLLFASVPSALHSHKPPLLDLLQLFVDIKEPAILELFARYLLPNTTSVGYEPLKWQHISLYETL